MFGTIRKHQGWLWWVIIVIIICTFVVFFAPTGSNQNASSDGGPYRGAIDGREITQREYRDAWIEAHLRYFFMSGQWPDGNAQRSGFNDEEQTYQQLLLVRKLEELNIDADPASAAKAAGTVMRQMNNDRPIELAAFVKQYLANRVTLEDVERFFRHDVAIRQLVSVIGLSGQLVTPQEAREMYERENRQRATQAAFFSASNFLASVKDPATNALLDFYKLQQSRYRVPEKRQVSYVAFPASNYLAQAEKALTNLSAIVDGEMARIGTNISRWGATPEIARVKIREEVLRLRALQEARMQAGSFASELFGLQPEKPENLAALAKTNGFMVKTTAPFDSKFGPEDLNVGPDFTRAAFELSPTEIPFRGPLVGEDAVYVIAFGNVIPSHDPPLESIRARVLADYRLEQAVLLAQEAGTKFAQTATIAQGKSFADLCAAAKVKAQPMPPVSIGMRQSPQIEEHLTLPYYKQIVFSTPVGKASNFAPTAEGGVVVFVEKELPIDTKRMEEEMPRFMSYLRQQREQEAFYFWFNKTADKSLRRPARPAPQEPQQLGQS